MARRITHEEGDPLRDMRRCACSQADVCGRRLSWEESFPRPERYSKAHNPTQSHPFVHGAAMQGAASRFSDQRTVMAFRGTTKPRGSRVSQRCPRAIIVPRITMLGSVPTFSKIFVSHRDLARGVCVLKRGLL